MGELSVHYKLHILGEKDILIGSASVSNDDIIQKHAEFVLLQNIPNPFNPTTTIGYIIPQDTYLILTIHNVYGQQVKTIKDGIVYAGKHSVKWDDSDIPGGVYFYQLRVEGFIETRKMLLYSIIYNPMYSN